MSPLHVLAHEFTPAPQDGLAYSAMPNAPVLPVREPARRRRAGLALVRRTGGRLRRLALPRRVGAATPVRRDRQCSPA